MGGGGPPSSFLQPQLLPPGHRPSAKLEAGGLWAPTYHLNITLLSAGLISKFISGSKPKKFGLDPTFEKESVKAGKAVCGQLIGKNIRS